MALEDFKRRLQEKQKQQVEPRDRESHGWQGMLSVHNEIILPTVTVWADHHGIGIASEVEPSSGQGGSPSCAAMCSCKNGAQIRVALIGYGASTVGVRIDRIPPSKGSGGVVVGRSEPFESSERDKIADWLENQLVNLAPI